MRCRRVAIVQSNYLPWKGYFDLIAAADEFVFLDDVQYTTRDWRNRNRIKTPQGLHWLSVPVHHTRTSRICDVTIAGEPGAWARKHCETIRRHYAAAPAAAEILPWISKLFDHAASLDRLAAVNHLFISAIVEFLRIETPLRHSTDVCTLRELDECSPSERLLTLCRRLNATSYLTGPSARPYLQTQGFDAAGITIEWMEYDSYPAYRQLHGEYESRVSIVDLLLMTGRGAGEYMQFAPKSLS